VVNIFESLFCVIFLLAFYPDGPDPIAQFFLERQKHSRVLFGQTSGAQVKMAPK
jgi:hypothetical protein